MTSFYTVTTGACLALTLIATLITWHACRRAENATLRAEVLHRALAAQTQRYTALEQANRRHAYMAVMSMPVLECTDVYIEREINLN